MELAYSKITLAIFFVLSVQSIAFAADQSILSWPSMTDHLMLPTGGQKTDAFHMVVIGDSIAWGNGLNTENKYYYLVADWLQEKLNRAVDVRIYAHSGAHISGISGKAKSIDPNLNSEYPTLMDQVNSIQNEDDVDLVLISGGINDVGIFDILNIYKPAEELDQSAQSIKDQMKDLLSSLSKKCKNAKIIVTNYYPIVSDNTDSYAIRILWGVTEAATKTAIKAATGQASQAIIDLPKTIGDAATVKERLVENSYMFYAGITEALTNATLETENAEGRITLVSPIFKSENCYAASDTWLWVLEGPTFYADNDADSWLGRLWSWKLEEITTNDDQFEYRSFICNQFDYLNKINAMAHPNRHGAEEYARAIESAIESKGPNWIPGVSDTRSNDSFDISRWLDSVIAWISPWIGMGQVESSSTSTTWNKTFDDNSGFACAQQTTDGGYIAVGSIDSWITFKDDLWIVKTDAYGNKQWEKTYGGFDNDWGGIVRQTTDGGYIIKGTTFSYGGGRDDAWLVKTDANGNKQWDKTFGGPGQEWGCDVQQTRDGGYIFLYNDDYHFILVKMDDAGNIIWNKYFGESDPECNNYGRSVQQASDGGYLIIGSTCFSDSNRKKRYAWLIKTDINGDRVWDKAFGGSGFDEGYSVRVTRDGGIIIICHRIPIDERGYFLGEEVWIIKTDSDGNEIWEKPLGIWPPSALSANSLSQAIDGGYITIGTENGDGKASLVKTDSDGNKLWSRSYGVSYQDRYSHNQFNSFQQTGDGGYIITGFLNPDVNDPNDNIAWLIKTDANGNVE